MSAPSPAGSENSRHGPKRVGMGEKIVRFVFKTAVYGMFAIFGLGILFGFIDFLVSMDSTGSRRAAPRLECLNNARQIGLALQSYHSKYGSFPPAYVADASGNPLYSWRVLLLPFLEQELMYEQFHHDARWDSPHNKQFIDAMPRSFWCPSDPRERSHFTSVVAVTGPGTVFDGTKSCRLADITDGPDKTLLLVETAESNIVWTEPRDLPLATLNLKVNADRKGISSPHGTRPSILTLWTTPPSEGANVIFCDGHGRFLRNTMPSETMRALITINGGERLTDEDF